MALSAPSASPIDSSPPAHTAHHAITPPQVTFLNITGFRDFPLNDLPMLEVLKQVRGTYYTMCYALEHTVIYIVAFTMMHNVESRELMARI